MFRLNVINILNIAYYKLKYSLPAQVRTVMIKLRVNQFEN